MHLIYILHALYALYVFYIFDKFLYFSVLNMCMLCIICISKSSSFVSTNAEEIHAQIFVFTRVHECVHNFTYSSKYVNRYEYYLKWLHDIDTHEGGLEQFSRGYERFEDLP